jgi:hypothetical protein
MAVLGHLVDDCRGNIVGVFPPLQCLVRIGPKLAFCGNGGDWVTDLEINPNI